MKTFKFFDTTLRDGEQAPGNTMSPSDKVRIAQALEAVGIDTIEAGFPAASPEDYEGVTLVSSVLRKATVCAFSRCIKEDIDIANKTTQNSNNRMLGLFYAISDLHLEKKYHITRADALVRIKDSVVYARQHFEKIKFILEDASRADHTFLSEAVDVLVAAGVTVVCVADTTGWATPQEMYNLTADVVKRIAGRASVSVHCHNDLGMATANTLSAVLAGADEADVTVNGIGERTGNAAFEEVVAALMVRKDFYQREMRIKLEQLMSVSELVYNILGRSASFEKPIVGVNAFRHEAGIHVSALKKDPLTYEILSPEKIGRERKYISGRHSSRNEKT